MSTIIPKRSLTLPHGLKQSTDTLQPPKVPKDIEQWGAFVSWMRSKDYDACSARDLVQWAETEKEKQEKLLERTPPREV